jgi:plasmid stability protein
VAQVLVRDLKADVVARLKARAKRHGRSLQTELKEILETASRYGAVDARALADRIRRQLTGRVYTDSVELLAEDRER